MTEQIIGVNDRTEWDGLRKAIVRRATLNAARHRNDPPTARTEPRPRNARRRPPTIRVYRHRPAAVFSAAAPNRGTRVRGICKRAPRLSTNARMTAFRVLRAPVERLGWAPPCRRRADREPNDAEVEEFS